MRRLVRAAALGLALIFSAGAHAAYIPGFAQVSNDGVYSITPELAATLGLAGATHIGAIGIRTTTGLYDIGDTFDAASLLGSTGNDAAIIGFVNGTSPSAGYTGVSIFDALGLTTVNAFDRASDRKLFAVAFFGFDAASGNIVFNGTSTFNAGQSQGDFGILVVPEPAALALLGLGLVAVGLRRRAA